MDPRNTDILSHDDMSQRFPRDCEDYLDWLENQDRAYLDLFRPFRLLAGISLGLALMIGVSSFIL